MQKLNVKLNESRSVSTKYELFLDSFKLSLDNPTQPPPADNPFLSFRLDRKKLSEIFS